MTNLKVIILVTFLAYCYSLCSQTTFNQHGKEYVDSCDQWNTSKNGKFSISDLKDLRLQNILKSFFTLDDTDTTASNYFIDYPCNHCENTAAYMKINNGLAKGYEINLKVKPFNISNHIIKYKDAANICQIDNKGFWGVDTELPKEEISELTVKYYNKAIFINPNQYNDLFNPYLTLDNWCHLRALMDKKGEYFFVCLNGSEYGLTYVVVWIFRKDQYIGRVVNYLG